MKNNSLFSSLRSDLPASIVVFLVAMPLCLGIALASGAPLFSGIISGIVGGIVVAAFSGSPIGVSGPAAGLAVIVLTAIQSLGSFDVFLLAVVLAGAIQLALGYIKAGVIGYYFPSSVIKGMLSGIGIIIILKQIPHAFGYDNDPEGDLAFHQPDGQTTFSELGQIFQSIDPAATIIAFVSLAVLILWEQGFMKRISLFKIVQGPLVAVVGSVMLGLYFASGNMALAEEHMVSIPVADGISGFFAQFKQPNWSAWNNTEVYVTAVTIAVVASLETLLCVEATDKLDPLKRVTPTNRELKAQGIGNMIAGLIGGLPVTQVIVRSSANIQSGAKSKMSAILHGFLLLITAMAIPHIINLIPLASLAAILLVVGYKLAKPSLFKSMFQKGPSEYIPFMVTILGIVFTDLLMGIALGMVVAIFHILWNNLKLPYHLEEEIDIEKPIRIKLAEEVSFLNKASILQTLNHVPDGATLIVDAERTRSMHPDVQEIIHDFRINAESRGISMEVIQPLEPLNANPVKHFEQQMGGNRDVGPGQGDKATL